MGFGRLIYLVALSGLFTLIAGCADRDKTVFFPPDYITVEAGNGRLTLGWTPVSGATSYGIYISTTPGAGKGGERYESGSSPRTITGLENNTTYYIVVTSIYGSSESAASEELSAAPVPVPNPPSGLNGVAGEEEIRLSWAKQAGVSYRIYWSYTQGVSTTTYDGVIDAAITPFLHSGLSNNTTYYYIITALNAFGESVESEELSVIPAIPSGSALTVKGNVRYQDREYDSYGFTGVEGYKPVRYATVEAVFASSTSVMASGTTDSFGNYSIVFTASTSLTLYMRVISETAYVGKPEVQVLSLGEALFSVAGADIVAEPGMKVSSSLSLPLTLGASGAFNILDVMTAGGEFVTGLSALNPPQLKLYWQDGNRLFGTWYCNDVDFSPDCRFGAGIYVLGGDSASSGDHDEYDDDVLLHEYAHFVAYNYSRDDSPGGVHYLSGNDIDLRLAWSEGWGDFFPAAAKRWAIAGGESFLSTAAGTPEALYLDMLDNSLLSFDITEPTSSMIYASNEVAVANVLWNTMTGTSEGMDGVWRAIGEYIPNIHDVGLPVNMEAFWDGWLSNEAPLPAQRAGLEGFFKARGIDYSIDMYESDGLASPARKLAVGASETHKLYGGDDPALTDIDYIAFDALAGLSYNISTSDLENGADTKLRLIDRDGATLLDENDNGIPDQAYTAPYNLSLIDGVYHENDGTTLASSIIFTPYSSGTYYLEVTPSTERPESAGRYGSYRLNLNTP